MTRTPEDGEPQFIDVFGGMVRRSRDEMLAFVGAMGIVPHEHLLAPTAPRQVAARMIRNLLHLTGVSASGLRPACVLHLHSASLLLQPPTLDALLQRFAHACDAGEVHLAQQDFDALLEASEVQALLPEHRRQLVAVAGRQLDRAYDQVAGR